MGSKMLSGYPLSDVDVGLLQKLLAKYAPKIAELRAKPDGYTSGPDPGTARIGGAA